MKLICLAAALAIPALCQSNPFIGRWDITVTAKNATYPQWMELVEKDGGLSGRIQPRGGAVRPIPGAKLEGPRLIVSVSAATAKGPAVTWELTADGGKLTGIEKRGDTPGPQLSGVRAPDLKRAAPRAWSDPEPLFNGRDLTGWEPTNTANNHWIAKDGELVNQERGANIKTTRTFDDFKLHIEVNCPEHCNSGIYLRGRYEIQVGTEGGSQPSHEMGAIYGYVPAAGNLPLKTGEWDIFDITLIGRTVTVVRNGVTIHDHVEIPGITGGALDSHEGEPGPIYIQGDHTGGLRYRNIKVSVPKR